MRFERFVLVLSLCAGLFLLPTARLSAGNHAVACGGSRASLTVVWEDPEGNTYNDKLYGGAFGEVEGPHAGDTTVSGEWFSNMLFGHIPAPGIGDVIMRYQPYTSNTISVTSNSPTGSPFFPASVSMSLNYQIDVLDASGNVVRSLATRTPCTLESVVNAIPPIGSAFYFQNDLEFYDVIGNPSTPALILRSAGTAGYVGNPGGLAVTLVNSNPDFTTGTFTAEWAITNQTGAPINVNWFTAPVRDVQILSQDLMMDVPVSSTVNVTVAGTLNPNASNSGIVFHAVSSPGWPMAEGHIVEYFTNSSQGGGQAMGATPILFILALLTAAAAGYFLLSERHARRRERRWELESLKHVTQ